MVSGVKSCSYLERHEWFGYRATGTAQLDEVCMPLEEREEKQDRQELIQSWRVYDR
jgi:Na+/H+ antiporter NhaB